MRSLKNLTYLSLEIGRQCNLSKEHPECPSQFSVRLSKGSPTTVFDIVEVIDSAVDMGFNGFVGFHYYNEPLLHLPRILSVMQYSPYKKYVLWTNGELINRGDRSERAYLEKFQRVVITNYKNDPWYESLREEFPSVEFQISPPAMDSRLDIYSSPEGFMSPCRRANFELPIDHFGNVHLCCQDWLGEVSLGNVKESSLKDIVESYNYGEVLDDVMFGEAGAPNVCHKCTNRM